MELFASPRTVEPVSRIEPSPPSPIAAAARRYGDAYPLRVGSWSIRVAGLVLIAAAVVYLPWMFTHLNLDAPWISVPFAAANLLTMASLALTVVNSWKRTVPPPRPVPHGAEPHVAVIIPTCGESIPMILRTVESVRDQDYPSDKVMIVVSDDGHDSGLEAAVVAAGVHYHSPPPRWAPGRDGAAKAGNLNSAVRWLDEFAPHVRYIETRDADDEVGSNRFLRLTVGQLEADANLAFVQTIKEAQVSAGDPFNNRESMFYRNQMLAKNAANAVFPCGSGVIWRRTALRSIGDFPTWNLVEDLQSGVEALRRGWRGMYLPIVGAVGQHSPEDVPNVFKQRGTWAVDTIRLFLWGDLSGLNPRQRAHFGMLPLFYLTSFAVLTYLLCIASSLTGTSAVLDDSYRALWFILPFAIANEAWLLVTNHPWNDRRTKQRGKWVSAWRVRVLWTGLAPVYAKAAFLALFGGRERKPVYKVTRKEHDLRWHWRQTLPHIVIVVVTTALVAYALEEGTLRDPGQILATVYFGAMYLSLVVGFVMRGWHGVVTFRMPTVERRRGEIEKKQARMLAEQLRREQQKSEHSANA